MEQWESLLESYPEPPDPKSFTKAIRTADKLLQNDLANFEIERIFDTLLYRPVGLLNTVSKNRMEETWWHPVRESFKLLADAVTRHSSAVEVYCDDIIKVSLLPFDSEGQKNALTCLERVARVHTYDAGTAIRHINQLENADVCKSQLALIVGTICECHPQTVENEINRIWRIYLRMLESKKNTDTLLSAILQGLSGLFHSFGMHLPMSELNTFYDILVKCFNTSKCETVVITILEKYSNLFKERLSDDVNIRHLLWERIREKKGNEEALRSIYTAISTVLSKDRVQNILNNEVLPRADAADTNTKFSALRLLVYMRNEGFSFGDLARFTDVHTLEFQLHCGTISYNTSEEICWCIESNLPNSDKLLQTAILFSVNLPASRRVDIISRGILNSPDYVRKETIVFLTTESIQHSDNGDSIQKYMDVWSSIIAGSNPATSKVIEDFVAHVVFVLDMFLEEGGEEVPDRLSSLLTLTSYLLPLSASDDAPTLAAALLPRLLRCSASAAMLALAAVSERLTDLQVVEDYCKGIEISRCKDEATLCAACLLLIRVQAEPGQVLLALQIIFSRNDVDMKTLQLSMEKLEYLITNERDRLDETRVDEVLRLVDKLRTRIDLTNKDGRILHRRIVMFIGRYGRKYDVNNNTSTGDWVVAKLKDGLSLKIPHVDQGAAIKINLQTVLEMAIEEGETGMLLHFLTIICADPRMTSQSEAGLPVCAAVVRLCQALCRLHAAGAEVSPATLQDALLRTGGRCLPDLLQFISEETSPGARRMLSELLGAVLQSGSDELLDAAAEQALVMVTAADSVTRRAGLDLTEIILAALAQNDSLTKSLLPRIIELISTTNELESKSTIDIAAGTYIDKIALFDVTVLRDLIEKIVGRLLVFRKLDSVHDMGIYRYLCKRIMAFVKEAINIEKEELSIVFDVFLDVYKKSNPDFYQCIHLLAIMKNVIGFDSRFCSNVLTAEGLLERVYAIEIFDDTNRFEPDLFRLQAVLVFFEEYADGLLELSYKKTMDFLAKIVKNITPHHVVHLDKNLENCLKVYKNILKSIPNCIQANFEEWCLKLPLPKITQCIKRNAVLNNYIVVIKSLKILLNILELRPPLTEVKSWPKIVLSNYSRIKMSDMSFLTDCLTVAVKYLTDADVRQLILDGVALRGVSNEMIGVKFCSRFINVFLPSLKRLLLEPGLEDCCCILQDIVMYYVMKTSLDICELLDLVDKLWPIYEGKTSFHQKHRLLYNLSRLPKKLGPDSNPLRWVADQLASDISRECKISLVSVLPAGDGFSACYGNFAASCLPSALSEVRGPANAALRAALDALAATADLKLLDIVLTLAGSEDRKGWWDEAIDSCAASLARSERSELYEASYKRCWSGLSLGVTERIVVPLLRYSTPVFCERFISTKIEDLLNKLKFKPRMVSQALASNLSLYRKCVIDRIRALQILQVAFEKISLQSLLSPQSTLYNLIEVTGPYYLIRETCSLCVTLRREECPAAADGTLRADFKQFQYAIYKCLSAAICKRRPVEKFYDQVLCGDAWTKITDEEIIYKLPVFKNKRKTRHSVSIEVAQGGSYLSTASVRTHMFLRTLSEDPLNYDLISQEESTQVTTQELVLIDNELSRHPCAGTLTALFSHVIELSYSGWVRELADALRRLHVNTRWMLAQVIINCKDDLKQHASVLRPALLELVANTPREEQHRKTLNGLHIDILDTLTQWRDDTEMLESSRTHLNTAIEYLICTTIDTGERYLLEIIDRMLEVYGSDVTVPWSCFSGFIEDSPIQSHQNKNSLSILKRITKHKIRIPELVPTLVKYEKYWIQEHNMAELFGSAVTLECDKERAMRQFNKILDRARQKIDGYVKILYYAQQGCPNICDERQFRVIVDQTPKVQKQLKSKCLQIISVYISQKDTTNDYIASMFEAIELNELLSSVDSVEVLGLVGNGLQLMEEGIKRRAVMQVAEYCHHPDLKIRRAAYGVMVKAFEDLLNRNDDAPPTKRAKKKPTDILNIVYSDPYEHTVLSCVANTCDVACEVVRRLCSSDMRVRLAECLLLCVYMPFTKHQHLSPNTQLLEMLFSQLRTSQQFLAAKLRDEPLDTSSTSDVVSSALSKLLTKSATFQGTLRSYRATGYSGRIRKKKEITESGIDVQITIDSILDTLLKFAKKNTKVQEALTVEMFKSLGKGRGFDLLDDTVEQLAVMLALPPCDVTPLLVQLARVTIDNGCQIDGFYQTVVKLREVTSNMEGEHITGCLQEEIRLRCLGPEQFVLGSRIYESNVHMKSESDDFSLKDIIECFGKLSNWDDLTLQQKDLQSSGLPTLWTDLATFKTQLEGYTVTEPRNWFDKMLVIYNKCERDSERWLNEINRWPVKSFDVSAVIEAVTWNSEHQLPSIQRGDCIAEWAVRLQLRSAYLSSLADSETPTDSSSPSRSHELLWCARANEMALPELALQCIRRNEQLLDEHDAPLWRYQKLQALRAIALKQNDSSGLMNVLQTAESNMADLFENSSEYVGTGHLVLSLHQHLNSLSYDKIHNLIDSIDTQYVDMSVANKRTLESMYELAMNYYDELWTREDGLNQNELLQNMSDVLHRVASTNPLSGDIYLAVILNRLANYNGQRLDDNMARALLDQLQRLVPHLDEISREQIKASSHLFPPQILADYDLQELFDDSTDRYKKYFALVRDPKHSLRQYCMELDAAVKRNDTIKYENTFSRIRELLDNPHAGTSYQLLRKQRDLLYSVPDLSTPKNDIRKVLLEVINDLSGATSSFRLSQLCPALTRPGDGECERDKRIARLLSLGNLRVVKFEEKVSIFVGSIRRPAVMGVLLSDGSRRRLLHKAGESLRTDAAAHRIFRLLRSYHIRTYTVTPLCEDSGLIEFLEDHKSMHSLISSKCDLDNVKMSLPRAADHELILGSSVEQYQQFAAKVPAYLLRSVLEEHSSSLQDFIAKKRRFQDTLASATVHAWILGLGDRHLDNVLCSTVDGAVCCVDWGAALQYGTRELPAARLTRNILAVCDAQVLESRIQNVLSTLRASHELFAIFIKMSFSWMGREFGDKLAHIRNILSGSALSYHVTRLMMESTDLMYKERYLKLLDEVFQDFKRKDRYSVVEQVTCLLRHCTDPRILSVTRTNWDPWV